MRVARTLNVPYVLSGRQYQASLCLPPVDPLPLADLRESELTEASAPLANGLNSSSICFVSTFSTPIEDHIARILAYSGLTLDGPLNARYRVLPSAGFGCCCGSSSWRSPSLLLRVDRGSSTLLSANQKLLTQTLTVLLSEPSGDEAPHASAFLCFEMYPRCCKIRGSEVPCSSSDFGRMGDAETALVAGISNVTFSTAHRSEEE